jgi:hypothetical protein
VLQFFVIADVAIASTSQLQEFPPAPGGNGGGYQPLGGPAGN